MNCHANDLISQLDGCSALMWHFSHENHTDNIIAKQIMFALEHTGFIVFPDFRTMWHFDDKAGQKYLFESIQAPYAKSYVFLEKEEALKWASETKFPKVFKLRGGASSKNVRLLETREQAARMIHKAFSKGFSKYDGLGSLRERWYKYRKGKSDFFDVFKGVVRLIYPPAFARLGGHESGYVLFQEFLPENDSDTRIIVIGSKAFGLKRYVRDNDFRASGSGDFAWDRSLFDERCIQISFDLCKKLNLQIGAFDFVFDAQNNPLVIELSYGFVSEVYDPCPGYWDESLTWHEGTTTKEDFMVEVVLEKVKRDGLLNSSN
ncbi:hypothetical protein A3SI_06744 [Nitritalea halalkaliphila LW7]|uniref:ATP-grasp domain-containing protein n=1 Tax=Nitritalea halalkaliphila LW7 TaxID=1189621 RepID=I5C612_9BACT|nr:hypothetical protein A3SI_06744 [Nitritalea halalkaliphila LW7]